jgi:hypothetical protein
MNLAFVSGSIMACSLVTSKGLALLVPVFDSSSPIKSRYILERCQLLCHVSVT